MFTICLQYNNVYIAISCERFTLLVVLIRNEKVNYFGFNSVIPNLLQMLSIFWSVILHVGPEGLSAIAMSFRRLGSVRLSVRFKTQDKFHSIFCKYDTSDVLICRWLFKLQLVTSFALILCNRMANNTVSSSMLFEMLWIWLPSTQNNTYQSHECCIDISPRTSTLCWNSYFNKLVGRDINLRWPLEMEQHFPSNKKIKGFAVLCAIAIVVLDILL